MLKLSVFESADTYKTRQRRIQRQLYFLDCRHATDLDKGIISQRKTRIRHTQFHLKKGRHAADTNTRNFKKPHTRNNVATYTDKPSS